MGITFTVYGDEEGTERILPFDMVPRIIAAEAGSDVEAGLRQRITALNLFLDDIYHDQQDRQGRRRPERTGAPVAAVVPRRSASGSIRRAASGATSPAPTWCATATAQIYVLEDNLRCPVGRLLRAGEPAGDEAHLPAGVRRRRGCGRSTTTRAGCSRRCESLAPDGDAATPTVVVLTPGIYNSAYFEHSLPGPADGRRAGRGPRPGGRRRLRVHAHDARARSAWT